MLWTNTTSVVRDRLQESVRRDSATELATVNSRAMEGEAGLSWVDARYQIADSQTDQARIEKFEEVLQQVINEAQWSDHGRGNDAGSTTGKERPRRFRQEASEGGLR